MATLIRFQGVTKNYGSQVVLNNVDLSIDQGESVVVLGPSGSGKSVFLRLLADLEQPTAGRIVLSSDSHARRSLVTAMVFQQSALFDTMTVKQNLEFAWQHLRPEGHHSRLPGPLLQSVCRAVSLSLTDLEKKPSALSGGMAKRVALARALIARPRLLLYDEPTTGLDPVTSEQIARLIRRFHRPGSGLVTSLTITHDYRTAAWIADRVLYLNTETHQIDELMSRSTIEQICRDSLPNRSAEEGSDSLDRGDSRQWAVETLAAVLAERAKEHDIFDLSPQADVVQHVTSLSRLFRRSYTALKGLLSSVVGLRPPGNVRVLYRRLLDFGLGSVPFIGGSGLLIGIAMMMLLAPILSKFGMIRQLPGVLTISLLQEIAPLIAALLLAGRLGASIAAEMGAMVVTEQLDALRTMKETPERYLLTPIIEAVLLLQPLLTYLFVFAALGSGYLYAAAGSLIRPFPFWHDVGAALNEVGPWIVIIKSLVFGAIVALIGYQTGRTTGRSAGDVGRASRSAVVYASMSIIVADLFLNRWLAQ